MVVSYLSPRLSYGIIRYHTTCRHQPMIQYLTIRAYRSYHTEHTSTLVPLALSAVYQALPIRLPDTSPTSPTYLPYSYPSSPPTPFSPSPDLATWLLVTEYQVKYSVLYFTLPVSSRTILPSYFSPEVLNFRSGPDHPTFLVSSSHPTKAIN